MKPCMSGLTDESMRAMGVIDGKTVLTKQYLVEKRDWNQTLLDQSYQLMLKAKQHLECYVIKAESDLEFDEPIGYPEVRQIYKPPERQCLMKHNSIEIHSNLTIVLLIAFIAITIAVIIASVLLYFRRSSRLHNRLV